VDIRTFSSHIAITYLQSVKSTSGASGVLVLQMLGAVAEFERSLIRERVEIGIPAAKARGQGRGGIGLRNRDPAVIASLTAARKHARLMRLFPRADARRVSASGEVALFRLNQNDKRAICANYAR
jgi:DNA invertase Pin-like site-specific DNA recombinase